MEKSLPQSRRTLVVQECWTIVARDRRHAPTASYALRRPTARAGKRYSFPGLRRRLWRYTRLCVIALRSEQASTEQLARCSKSFSRPGGYLNSRYHSSQFSFVGRRWLHRFVKSKPHGKYIGIDDPGRQVLYKVEAPGAAEYLTPYTFFINLRAQRHRSCFLDLDLRQVEMDSKTRTVSTAILRRLQRHREPGRDPAKRFFFHWIKSAKQLTGDRRIGHFKSAGSRFRSVTTAEIDQQQDRGGKCERRPYGFQILHKSSIP